MLRFRAQGAQADIRFGVEGNPQPIKAVFWHRRKRSVAGTGIRPNECRSLFNRSQQETRMDTMRRLGDRLGGRARNSYP